MIDYTPFWETLKRQHESWYTMTRNHNVGFSTLHRLKNNKDISTKTINDLCKKLNLICFVVELVGVCLSAELSLRRQAHALLPVDCFQHFLRTKLNSNFRAVLLIKQLGGQGTYSKKRVQKNKLKKFCIDTLTKWYFRGYIVEKKIIHKQAKEQNKVKFSLQIQNGTN